MAIQEEKDRFFGWERGHSVGKSSGKKAVAKKISKPTSAKSTPAPKKVAAKPVAGKGTPAKAPAAKGAPERPISAKPATGKPMKAPEAKAAQLPAKGNKDKNSKPAVMAAPVPPPASKPAPKKVEKPERTDDRAFAPQPGLAVRTDGKPKKNLIGLTPKELEFFRDLLLAKRRELVGDMSSMEREALRTGGNTNLSNLPIHMADMGTDNYEQEFTLGLMEKDRKLLREINGALAKLQDGSYGICEGSGKPISKARLEAQPWAKFSIEYARKMEGRMR